MYLFSYEVYGKQVYGMVYTVWSEMSSKGWSCLLSVNIMGNTSYFYGLALCKTIYLGNIIFLFT